MTNSLVKLKARAKAAGMKYGTLHYRVKRKGWSVKRALSTPLLHDDQTTQAAKAWAAGLTPALVSKRLGMGWSLERALSSPRIRGKLAPLNNKSGWVKSRSIVQHATFIRRTKAGWSIEQALTTPAKDRAALRSNTRLAQNQRVMGARDRAIAEALLGQPVSAATAKRLKSDFNKLGITPPSLRADAKAAGLKYGTVRSRLVRWTRDQALGLAPPPERFRPGSLTHKARTAGLTRTCVEGRIERGMTLEEALSFPANGRPRKPNLTSMSHRARSAGLPVKVVEARIKLGWPVEKALTTPVRRSDLPARCKEAGLKYTTVRARIKNYGWSVEKALTTPVGDLPARCKEAGLKYATVRARIKKYGWSIERALTTPRSDLAGRCREAGLNYKMVQSRISNLGWSIERALTTPPLR